MSRIGAIRLVDPNTNDFLRVIENGGRGTPPLLELSQLMAASRAVEMNQETEADLRYLRGRGTSVGGMRPKCTVIDEDGHLAIGKFPSVKDDRSVTRGEILALHLAAAAGILGRGFTHRHVRRHSSCTHSPVRPCRRRRPHPLLVRRLDDASSPDRMTHAYTQIADTIIANSINPGQDLEELMASAGVQPAHHERR
ncbi:hypothetical protein ACU4GD_31585 [Cupriavidus basilensis]